jgi:hypothetical protein
MDDLPNNNQPNKDAALLLLAGACLVASIVLGLVWFVDYWWV